MTVAKQKKETFFQRIARNWKTNPMFSTGCVLVLMIIVQTIALGFNDASFGAWLQRWGKNWINILRNNAGVGIVALGMTFVIISGGIDLAVGSTMVAIGAVLMVIINGYPAGLLTAVGITGVPAYLIGILAAVLIALVLLAFDCINGDPISERWAMHRAIQFAEKLYPDQTFTAENAGSMRGFCYTTRVQSQQSKDTWFYVETHFWLFTSDIYTIDHTQYIDARLNTSNRMELEAQDEVAPVLVDALSEYDIPYDEAEQCVMVILPYESGKNAFDLGMEYQQWLPLDAPFEKDILQHIPAKLWVTIETTSQPQQADFQPALQKIKAACEANGYHFATYNVTMIQRDIPYETALAQCIESGDVAAGEI